MPSWKILGRQLLSPLLFIFIRLRIHPHLLSISGLGFAIGAAFFYAQGVFPLAGGILLVAGICDALDGELARQTGKSSKLGAILDSTLDRIGEFFIWGGLLFFYRTQLTVSIILYFALLFSMLVSYLRARGEGLGITVQSGFMDRAGRYFYIIILSFLGKELFPWGISLFILLTGFTVVLRAYELYNKLKC